MVRSLGIFIGKLTKQLQGWTHPTTYEFAWKMENYHLLKEKTHLLKNEEVRKMVQEFLQSYEKAVVPHYPKLRKRTIHNDVNQMNIIVNKGQVTGLIDFADVQYSHLINELGIALFYMMYDKEDILYYSLMLL